MTTTAPTDPTVDRYPTRISGSPQLSPRLDPVVYGDRTGPLGSADVDRFEEEGFLVLTGLLDDATVAAVDADLLARSVDPASLDLAEAVHEPDDRADAGAGGPAARVLRSLFAVHRLGGPLGGLARDPRLVGIARQLLGGDVYLHQTRANLKPAFRGKEFAWHSDFETWHAEDGMPAMRAVSCAVSLTDNHPWNGPLLVVEGSHRWFVPCVGETPADHHEQSLRRQEIGVPDDASLVELCRRGAIQHCLGPPGTAVFFDCNLMHGSSSNITPWPRRNVFMVYNSVDNALREPYAAPARRPEHIGSRDFTPV